MKALKKYAEDIDLLIERMNDQTTNMRKFYMDEIVSTEVNFSSLAYFYQTIIKLGFSPSRYYYSIKVI